MLNVVQGNVPVQEFTSENIIYHEKAVWEHNSILFVFDTIEGLKQELSRYFDPIRAGVDPGIRAG